jgi:hypothetical protein
MIKKYLLILLLLILPCFNSFAQSGKTPKAQASVCQSTKLSRQLCVVYQGTLFSNHHQATAELQLIKVAPLDKKEAASILVKLVVKNSSLFKDFNFDRFEGPGALAATAENFQITILSGSQSYESKSIAAGYYGVNSEASPPTFVFSASNAHLNSKKQMNKMLNLLSKSDAVIKIRVFDATNKMYPSPELKINLQSSSKTTPLIKEMLKLQ